MRACYAFTSGRGMLDTLPIEGGTLISRVWVKPTERRNGYGTQLLRWVCGSADREQETLYLAVEPDPGGPSAEALRAWYARHGFEGTGAMVRKPR